MAQQINRVYPGDLITAELMNKIMRAIENLDERVTILESGVVDEDSVVITELIPPGPIKVLEELKILGRNFKFSLGAHRVFFNNTAVNTYKPNSSDTMLIVDVPEIPNLHEGGNWITVTVRNGISSDSRKIKVLPLPQPFFGNVIIERGAADSTPIVDPSPILPGKDADFVYTITSAANLPAVFDISTEISGPDWQNLIRILDSNKSIISSREIFLNPNVPTKIFVRINPIPTNSTGTRFFLSVGATCGNVTGNSGIQNYTVGEVPEPQDETIGIKFEEVKPDTAISNNTIQLAENKIAHIILLATFRSIGEYDYKVSATLIDPAKKWFLKLFDPTPDSDDTPNIGTLPVLVQEEGSMKSRTLDIAIQPKSGASLTGQVEFKIQRAGVTKPRTLRLNLKLL